MNSRTPVIALLWVSVYTAPHWDTPAIADESTLPKLRHPFHVGMIKNALNTPIALIDTTGTFGVLQGTPETDASSIAIINSRFNLDPGRRVDVKSDIPRGIAFCQWGAHGDKFISVTMADVRVSQWPDLTTDRKWLLPSDTRTLTCIEVSPSGRQIAIGSVKTLFIFDTTRNDGPRLVFSYNGYATDIAFSPDESHIAYAGLMSPSLVVRDTRSGDVVYPSVIGGERASSTSKEVELAGMQFYGVAFSTDGRLFGACGASNAHSIGELRLWDWVERRHMHAVKQRGAIFRQIIFNDAVVYTGSCAEFFARTGSILEIETATGRHLSTFAGLPRPEFSMAIARDARVLAAATAIGEVYLWKTRSE